MQLWIETLILSSEFDMVYRELSFSGAWYPKEKGSAVADSSEFTYKSCDRNNYYLQPFHRGF